MAPYARVEVRLEIRNIEKTSNHFCLPLPNSMGKEANSSIPISPLISLCSSALNSSSSTARFLRCRSILRSMASRTETISRCSLSVGGNGSNRLSIAAVFRLNFPSEAEVALPATMLVPSSEPKKDAANGLRPGHEQVPAKERAGRAQGLHRDLRQGDRVLPDNAVVRYTVPVPDDSLIPAKKAQGIPLNGSAVSTVKVSPPDLTKSRTFTLSFTLHL